MWHYTQLYNAMLCYTMSSFFLSFRIIPYHTISYHGTLLYYPLPIHSLLTCRPLLPYLILHCLTCILPPPMPCLMRSFSSPPLPFPSIYTIFISILFFYSILFYYFSPLLTLFLPSFPLSSPPLIFLFSSLHSSSLFLPTPPCSFPVSPPLYIGGGRCRGIQRCLLLESIRAHCVCREAINRGNAIRSNSSEKQNKSPWRDVWGDEVKPDTWIFFVVNGI